MATGEQACAVASQSIGEALGGTATVARRWLAVEWHGAWGREAVTGSSLPDPVRETLGAFDGRAVLIRPSTRGGRTQHVVAFLAESTEAGGTLRRLELERIDDLAEGDLAAAPETEAPVLLVCGHGKRDVCCARLGPPLAGELAGHLGSDRVWQSSHLGGHRFAPNAVVLPWGVQLGRIPLDRVAEVVDLLARGRIPLDLYRGRTIYEPAVQAAEVAAREATGADGVGDLRLLGTEGGEHRVRFATPSGEVLVRIAHHDGPAAPVSCGEEPAPTGRWVTDVERGSVAPDG